MQKRPLQPLIIIIFDVLRFAIMASLLIALSRVTRGGLFSGGRNSLAAVPYLVYSAPLALFPLMAFFLWQNPAQYRPFAPLYIAGKTISIVVVVAWLCINWNLETLAMFFRFGNLSETISETVHFAVTTHNITPILLNFGSPLLIILTLGDIATILGIRSADGRAPFTKQPVLPDNNDNSINNE